MARHHVVQDKYLVQWRINDTTNRLNIFIISQNKCVIGNTKSKLFWRKDFNVLQDKDEVSYLPEDVTSVIDTKGISAIRKINAVDESQLNGEDRSAIAFYIALQYIRTPRYREESDKMIRATIQHFMRQDISSPEKVMLTKEEILRHKPTNDREVDILDKISRMSEEEIKRNIFESIHEDDYISGLTKTGHSKGILKVDKLAKDLFELQWLFLVAPNNCSFVTSDNPCFTISSSRIMNGLLSPSSTVFFPLRPDICVFIKPSMKSKTEYYMSLDSNQVRDINSLILSHSYQCLVAREKAQLDDLTKDYNCNQHRKSRDITVSEKGPYTMFNIE